MKKLMGLFVISMALCAGTITMAYAADDMATPASQTAVKGDLLKIDGEFYVVKDTSGKDVRLHVDKTTKLDGAAFKAGDKVEVQTSDKNHAVSIKHAEPTK
jgi:uncharacterized protein YdeI (BOF family)